jgi:hypothetical protein
MIKILLLSFIILFSSIATRASFVPAKTNESSKQQSLKPISLAEFESKTGKKLNWIQRLQFKKMQRMMQQGKFDSAWDAEELTEGFQFWPFIGSFLTLGTLYLVMLFTAKDSNALRWARWGAFAIWVVWLIGAIALISSGSYY